MFYFHDRCKGFGICAMGQSYDYSLTFYTRFYRNKPTFPKIGHGIKFPKNARLPHLINLA
ncbi:hypothetical protein THF1D04_60099 [Vibrio owensii]|uniref:Uncharacterized protein n=1 Tax=Vibrio owensii TaxID=696485 RepID=A0AAU9QAP4_9VIBR|nr:hypothetical protein THF1D04_60099 [Vibrio owensii]CAH1595212.1 hypothetical protein THZB04_80096 [Vibrio owensii]